MRVFLKSPVREHRTPGSVRGRSGNWPSYRDGGNMDATEAAFRITLDVTLGRVAIQQWRSDRLWSVRVKEAIGGVGRNFGWLTAAHGG
jgi:hypothetical protein